jgi:hypothetical protein
VDFFLRLGESSGFPPRSTTELFWILSGRGAGRCFVGLARGTLAKISVRRSAGTRDALGLVLVTDRPTYFFHGRDLGVEHLAMVGSNHVVSAAAGYRNI